VPTAGMRIALVERKLFGGTCVSIGCMILDLMNAGATFRSRNGWFPSTRPSRN
jgi:pyruvate/2-oxoglutarate dehydrogenase complex dihydrolipoamide dehydrogenase (E3) component